MSGKCGVRGAKACALLLGAVVAVTFAANAQSQQEIDLAIAKKNYETDQSEENYIWYGRRLAYVGRFQVAIMIYSAALQKYPNSYRVLRHRGHRYISMRSFDNAVDDLTKAELLMPEKLEIEPDGIPNKLNKPLSTTQFNVCYHLALAWYLKGDFAKAEEYWKKCLRVSKNDDTKVAALDWLYMTLRRQGKDIAAKKLLKKVHDKMEIIENDGYHQRLMMYKTGKPLPESDKPLDLATLGYGLGNWYLYNGDITKAKEIFKKIVAGPEKAAFGYIAAEADLARMK